MVKLYDASILLDGRPGVGDILVPDGASGGTGRLSAFIEPLELTQRRSGHIQAGDTITMHEIDHRVAEVHVAWGDSTTPRHTTSNCESLILKLVTGDPENVTWLWIVSDNGMPENGPEGSGGENWGHLTSYVLSDTVTLSGSWQLNDYSKNNDVTIDVTCFTTGTLIETDCGPRPVQSLRVGDMIRTRDHGMQPLRWLGGRRLSAAEMAANPNLHPIRIAAGALGPAIPARDLSVSPQHRVLVRSAIAERMTGSAEVLIAAVHLLGHPGIERISAPGGVGYWHLMFDRHEIVFADGAEAESLHLGPMALASMTAEAIAELAALFPRLLDTEQGLRPRPTARPVMRGKPVRKLIERQVRNFKPLVMAA